ncbi:MAG TPA: AcvB/VirJ family lysyl-phosphatidylglycerol hydrolase [Steroidobacteraceae bacterium]|jgi:type IV secretory pathway VirJ component
MNFPFLARHALLAVVFSILLAPAQVFAQAPLGVVPMNTKIETFEFGRFGTIHMYVPLGEIKNVAIFAGGDGRWDEGVGDMAQFLANDGALIIGIDTIAYLESLNASSERCGYMAADLEALAHAAEKRYALKTYMLPVIAGYSSGASLVYAALAQAPKGTFKGALSLGFCKDMDLHRAVCGGRGLATLPIKLGLTLQPMRTLGEPWTVLHGRTDEACSFEITDDFMKQVPGAKLVPLEKVGHGFAAGKRWHPQYLDAYRDLQKPVARAALPKEVDDLPLIEVPASGKPTNAFAVLITGDGGYAGLDRDLAAGLSKAGIPVVVLNSLKYFWEAHPAKQTAQDVERIVEHYAQQWQRNRVLLVGYSFGANVLPAVANQLDPTVQARVDSVSLIGLEPKASFEIRVAGWLGKEAGEQAVLPEIQKLAAARVPVLCIRGTEEKDSLCESLTPALAHVEVLPGGHHYNGKFSALVQAILASRPAQ